MCIVQDKITEWKARLERRIRAAEQTLIQSVVSSGALTRDELRDLLSIEDHRGLIDDLGRALRLGPRITSFCEGAAASIAALQCFLSRWLAHLWRYGGGHLAYVLVGSLEPVILLRRWFVAIVCSRLWLKIRLWRRRLSRRVVLGLCNNAFWAVINIALAPTVVTAIQWFHRRIWPHLVGMARLFHSIASIARLFCRLIGIHGTIPTAFRVTMALARRRSRLHAGSGRHTGSIADPESPTPMRLARAILGRDLTATGPGRRGEELWVDISPVGPLFATTEVGGIRTLWQRIHTMSNIDRETYEEILRSFQYPPDDVIAAVTQIAGPPRPLLSAVMVATGLRMGLADRLAKLGCSHLRRESSRWKFFGRTAGLRTAPRRYVVVTPLNSYQHQKPRIAAGKLIARILEVALGRDDSSSFDFVFVLPVCRPGTVESEERQKLEVLVQATLAASHMPAGVTTSILDDLYTDVWLPNLKGMPLILALRQLCRTRAGDDVLAISEMNDSASWLNIPYLAAALPTQVPALVTGRRPIIGAGKPVAGHAATRLFNCIFRFLVPNVTVRDSSSVLKVATVASVRAIVNDLTCLDYSIDQDVLAMMAVRGCVVEKPIEWYQAKGRWGHERPASAQIASLIGLGRKARFKRRLASLKPTEWLPLDAGFDFQALTNDRGIVLKGHAPERNRLILLLSALRLAIKRNPSEEGGHREFARFVPLATRLIGIVGQAPLKAVLRLAEGRCRDPLPSIREHLKYQVPAIVQTALVWRPEIDTPIGRTRPFLFALEQPFATLGTLRSAMEWNMRFGDVAGAADTLRVILSLQETLVTHGVVDPDMKSLLDCGVFIEDGAVVVKHLDFSGFLRDPYVIAVVLPGLIDKIRSMRDFRQIARWLRRTPEGRAHVVRFRDELDAFVRSVQRRLATAPRTEFAPVAAPDPPPAAVTRHTRELLVDHVIATAKFAAHAPIGTRQVEILMRQAAGYGSARLFAREPSVTFTPSTSAMSTLDPVFVVGRPEVGEAIEHAMAHYLPGRRYDIVLSAAPEALALVKLLRDNADRAGGSRVVMCVSGRSSRMQDLLLDGCLHKALMPLLGRPLFVHSLEAMQALAAHYPDRVWLTHPDTIGVWGQDAEWPNPEADIVVPLPREAFRLFEAYKRGGAKGSSRAQAAGKLFARCYLTLRTGGYSLPSLIGVKKCAVWDLPDEASGFGSAAESDFWGYLSQVAVLPQRWRRGEVATPMPQTWFDVDEPLQLMAFYRHALIPGFAQLFGSAPQLGESNWENCINVRSTIDTSAEQEIRLRGCMFDNSKVMIDLDPRVPHAAIEGLVVANSNVRIRIAAPAVRDNLVYAVTTAPGQAVMLSLDGQAIAPSAHGVACAVPLPLRAFSRDGHSNELLRCPGLSVPRPVAMTTCATEVLCPAGPRAKVAPPQTFSGTMNASVVIPDLPETE
jgi:hypothetical protein